MDSGQQVAIVILGSLFPIITDGQFQATTHCVILSNNHNNSNIGSKYDD